MNVVQSTDHMTFAIDIDTFSDVDKASWYFIRTIVVMRTMAGMNLVVKSGKKDYTNFDTV